MFVAFDHVQLAMPVGGEEDARLFYGDVLGFEEVEKPAPMRGSGGVWFRSGCVELHLGAEAGFRPARKAHPGLRVDDIDELASRLSAAGLMLEWDERYTGVRRFYVADPFGNRVEILQPAEG
jgi:catechol 2,3-dioxygenase-like lactoylglutathione lyase family enzyme